MTLPVRIPPVVERWDCHGCGRCCRAVIVPVSDADLARLQSQHWDRHPDYRGVRIVVRQGLWKKRRRLALTAENQCVFLTAQGRCRIHELYGESAKPLLCRMFPFQLAALDGYAYVTLRRHCPSAAADSGRTLEEQLPTIRQLAEQRDREKGDSPHLPERPEGGHRRAALVVAQMGTVPFFPPPLLPGHRGSWPDFLRVAEALARFVLDERFPLVRRLAHGLKFCDLIERCRLQDFSGARLDELLVMLENSAVEEAGPLFHQRRAPGRAGALLFRQTALEYLRLHPSFVIRQSWRERWRLIVLAAAFARGRGRLPHIHPCFPPNTFEGLQTPLGHLLDADLRPLDAYFEAVAASKQYAVLSRRHWSLVENFRALALSHAIAMWLVRLSCADRPPQAEDVCGAVGAIDRGQTYAPLTGRRHRRRIGSLKRLGELPRLVAWYAR